MPVTVSSGAAPAGSLNAKVRGVSLHWHGPHSLSLVVQGWSLTRLTSTLPLQPVASNFTMERVSKVSSQEKGRLADMHLMETYHGATSVRLEAFNKITSAAIRSGDYQEAMRCNRGVEILCRRFVDCPFEGSVCAVCLHMYTWSQLGGETW